MPGRIRTCDLQSRSLTLYPTELRALNGSYFILFGEDCQGVRTAELWKLPVKNIRGKQNRSADAETVESAPGTKRAADLESDGVTDFS